MKFSVLLATGCEVVARFVYVAMFYTAFTWILAIMLGVEMVIRMIFFAMIVEEPRAIDRLFAGISAGAFNFLMTSPGLWVSAHDFDSTSRQKVTLEFLAWLGSCG